MKKIFYKINVIFLTYGFNVIKLFKSLRNTAWYFRSYIALNKQKGSDNNFTIHISRPILTEKDEQGGTMSGHYFHQDLYVARKIFEATPLKHLDIGSRTDGFVAHVASFREIELMDIREIKSTVRNINFQKADLMRLPDKLIESYDSISSLHAIEHFGLGRYSDPIDYFGHEKGIRNITAMLKANGKFYFSVPIGPQRIEFNAHRVFSIKYLLDLLSKSFDLESFSYINDKGDFFENVELTKEKIETNFNLNYGCGIFILVKK
jgi:hypothetical protein